MEKKRDFIGIALVLSLRRRYWMPHTMFHLVALTNAMHVPLSSSSNANGFLEDVVRENR